MYTAHIYHLHKRGEYQVVLQFVLHMLSKGKFVSLSRQLILAIFWPKCTLVYDLDSYPASVKEHSCYGMGQSRGH